MKKLLSLVLALMMTLSCAGCALAEEEEILVFLPLMEQLGDCTRQEADEETFYYDNATVQDLYTFLIMSSTFGAYYFDASDSLDDDDVLGFLLCVPGTDFSAVVLYSISDQQLVVSPQGSFYIPTQEMYDKRMAYLRMELQLPTGAGENILPQFYHCVGREPYASHISGSMEDIFDGQMCWTEYYDGIDQSRLTAYTLYMGMFGLEVWLDAMILDSELVEDTYLLHYSNGDAEVIVQYAPESQSAIVYYKPGVSYYLLSASELTQALGE